jgi:DNA-binding transcriptional regulator YiaG
MRHPSFGPFLETRFRVPNPHLHHKQENTVMLLTAEACLILSPNEMRKLRKHTLGMTLRQLTQLSGISVAQLSEYEHGSNGLRDDQLRTIERVLLDAARDRSHTLSRLLAAEIEPDETMAAGS